MGFVLIPLVLAADPDGAGEGVGTTAVAVLRLDRWDEYGKLRRCRDGRRYYRSFLLERESTNRSSPREIVSFRTCPTFAEAYQAM